jgi:hypothetical protein
MAQAIGFLKGKGLLSPTFRIVIFIFSFGEERKSVFNQTNQVLCVRRRGDGGPFRLLGSARPFKIVLKL